MKLKGTSFQERRGYLDRKTRERSQIPKKKTERDVT